MKRILLLLLLGVFLYNINISLSGCGQIVAPTGGPRDSIPPKLINADPKPGSVNFKGKTINLYFNEYVQVNDLQQNLLVSPTPKLTPNIDWKLRTVTIKLRDTLEPNTTYTINMGNAIQDLNENNPLKDFRYVFSTGPYLDSLEFKGKVEEAETGLADTTLIVLLYKNLSDTAVLKLKPKYISRLDHEGNFEFNNLAAGVYKVYALKDGDGSRTYNSKSEMFAFADTTVTISANTKEVTLFAYVEEKEKEKTPPKSTEKKLKYTSKVQLQGQDLLSPLTIEFNKPLKTFDKQKIFLTDTLNNRLANTNISLDSTNKIISLKNNWVENTDYKLVILKDVGADSAGLALSKSDTLRFKTRKETDYGSVKLRFINFDAAKNMVLEFVANNEIINSYPLTSPNWSATLFAPGDYELRILYDANKNGKWDPGNFSKRIQPEKGFTIQQKFTVKANFEKDVDIELPK